MNKKKKILSDLVSLIVIIGFFLKNLSVSHNEMLNKADFKIRES